MRIVKAVLTDSYKVHKTMTEYLTDRGMHDKVVPYKLWVDRLTDDNTHYMLVLHARAVIGMVWGRELHHEPKKTLLIEGRFLRRAFKGKHKFTREILKAQHLMSNDFETIRILLPKNGVKLKKYKVLGTLVEVSK